MSEEDKAMEYISALEIESNQAREYRELGYCVTSARSLKVCMYVCMWMNWCVREAIIIIIIISPSTLAITHTQNGGKKVMMTHLDNYVRNQEDLLPPTSAITTWSRGLFCPPIHRPDAYKPPTSYLRPSLPVTKLAGTIGVSLQVIGYAPAVHAAVPAGKFLNLNNRFRNAQNLNFKVEVVYYNGMGREVIRRRVIEKVGR